MKVVYKYVLETGIINTIPLPPSSEVLSVKIQKNKICMWVLQPINLPFPTGICHRSFMVVGTGHIFEANIKKYYGTVMTPNHTFVFHVFEVL